MARAVKVPLVPQRELVPERSRLTICKSCARRAILGSLALTPYLLSELSTPKQALAAYVEEEYAQRVFDLVAPSVVTIEDYKESQGTSVEEGVGAYVNGSKYPVYSFAELCRPALLRSSAWTAQGTGPLGSRSTGARVNSKNQCVF
jgi:hypothetical protein